MCSYLTTETSWWGGGCRGIWEQNGHYSFIDQNSRIIRNNNLFLLLPFSLLKGYFPKAKQNGRRTEKDLVSYVSPYPPPLILSLARQNMILYSSQRVRIKPVTTQGWEWKHSSSWHGGSGRISTFNFRFQKGRSVKFYRSTTLSHRTRLPATSNLGEIDRRSRLIVPQTSTGQKK